MRLTDALRRLIPGLKRRHTPQGRERVEAAPGRSGELRVAEDITLGTVVMEKGTYAVSYRADADAQLLVLTAMHSAGATEDTGSTDSKRVVGTRQLVARSTIFAEELEDKSLRVKLVQVSAE
jgi:hypothetical protein